MIIESSELGNIRADAAKASIALRLGCYDVFHLGHQKGMDYASSHADILVVGVMSNRYVTKNKGPDHPVNAADVSLWAVETGHQTLITAL